MPPSWAEDDCSAPDHLGSWADFDKRLEQAIGVPVVWEDREWFRMFQLIWFHADGIDADTKYRQAMATFYGQVALSPRWDGKANWQDWKKSQPDTLPTCFYFDYAASYAMPTVEALILTDRTQLQLCLNEFSIRLNEFRASAFCQRVYELGGLLDPIDLAAQRKVIVCRATITRKDDNAIALALQEQTGVLYMPIRLTRYCWSAAVIP